MTTDIDWYDIALEHQGNSNYSQALVSIEKYTQQNPENKYGKLLKAIIYGDLANYKKVLSILAEIPLQATDELKYCSLYYCEYGDTYKEMGNYREAVKWYDRMIELQPEHTSGYIMKGACLASAGEYELAKQAHLKAITLAGDPEEAYYNLALILRAESQFEQAKHYCEKALEIDPNDKKVRHCYSDIKKAIKLKMKNGG